MIDFSRLAAGISRIRTHILEVCSDPITLTAAAWERPYDIKRGGRIDREASIPSD